MTKLGPCDPDPASVPLTETALVKEWEEKSERLWDFIEGDEILHNALKAGDRLAAALETARVALEPMQRVIDAAHALDTLEDFSEPIGPGQDPEDWTAYNEVRRELGEALAALPLPALPKTKGADHD